MKSVVAAIAFLADGKKTVGFVLPYGFLCRRLEILSVLEALFFKTFFRIHHAPHGQECHCADCKHQFNHTASLQEKFYGIHAIRWI